MPFLQSTRLLYAEPESTAGLSSDPLDKTNDYLAPTPSDVRIRALDITTTPERDDENSKYNNGGYSGDESIVGKTASSAKFSIKATAGEFVHGVSAGHKLNHSKFIETSGCEKIVIKDTEALADIDYPVQYMYYPTMAKSASTMTLTEVAVDETGVGIATEVIGAIGNFTITADGTGKPLTMEFTYSGSTANDDSGVWEIDATDTPKLKFDSANVMKTVAEKFLLTTITITNLDTLETASICTSKVTFDSGNTASPINCQIGESGIKNNIITAMQPRFSVIPILQQLSDFEYWKGMTKQHKYSIDMVVDTTSANIPPIRLFIPRAELLTAPRSDDNGIITQETMFRPLENTGKVLPVLKYYDATTGTPATFSYTGTSIIGREFDATWMLMIGEREVQ